MHRTGAWVLLAAVVSNCSTTTAPSGPDAASVDGGSVDTGSVDAGGVDAGGLDSGNVDIGTVDVADAAMVCPAGQILTYEPGCSLPVRSCHVDT